MARSFLGIARATEALRSEAGDLLRAEQFGLSRDGRYRDRMDFDGLLFEYFGTTTLDDLSEAARAAGVDRILIDFGLSRDRASRFALWALLHVVDAAPDLDVAFADPADREAARNLMDLLASSQGVAE